MAVVLSIRFQKMSLKSREESRNVRGGNMLSGAGLQVVTSNATLDEIRDAGAVKWWVLGSDELDPFLRNHAADEGRGGGEDAHASSHAITTAVSSIDHTARTRTHTSSMLL